MTITTTFDNYSKALRQLSDAGLEPENRQLLGFHSNHHMESTAFAKDIAWKFAGESDEGWHTRYGLHRQGMYQLYNEEMNGEILVKLAVPEGHDRDDETGRSILYTEQGHRVEIPFGYLTEVDDDSVRSVLVVNTTRYLRNPEGVFDYLTQELHLVTGIADFADTQNIDLKARYSTFGVPGVEEKLDVVNNTYIQRIGDRSQNVADIEEGSKRLCTIVKELCSP